jgi:PmbA protein
MMQAKKALSYAVKAGAEEAEVYSLAGRSVSIDLRKEEIDLAREGFVEGIGIRAIVNGAVGFASTNNPSQVEEAAVLAVKSARVRAKDPEWKGLPYAKKYPHVKGIFDGRISELEVSACIDHAAKLIDGVNSWKDVRPTSGRLMAADSSQIILNTNGVEVEERDTILEASIEAIAKDGGTSTAYEFDVSRGLDIDFYQVGAKAAELAYKSLGGKSMETQSTNVLLRPQALADILENTLISSLRADNVQKGRSSLIGKLGERIAAESLTIVDDGILEGGIGTSKSDVEGTPSQRNAIVKKGVLKTYLHDSYTAGKGGVWSTGNAIRPSYGATPMIGIRNLILEHPSCDVIASTDKGVLVSTVIGAHTSNPVSGDFSLEARNVFVVKDGELAEPVRSLMISGNIFDLLDKIDAVGKDVRTIGNVILPTVRFTDMRVVG